MILYHIIMRKVVVFLNCFLVVQTMMYKFKQILTTIPTNTTVFTAMDSNFVDYWNKELKSYRPLLMMN